MRLWFATIVVGVVVTGSAEASSFVSVEPPAANKAPSIVAFGAWTPEAKAKEAIEAAQRQSAIQYVGAPAAMTSEFQVALAYPLPDSPEATEPSLVMLSPSIIAFDPPIPSVTFEQVAAIIPASPRKQFAQTDPIVIRGGLIGGASAAPALVTLPKPAATASAADQKMPNPVKPEVKINAAGKKVVVISAERAARRPSPEIPKNPSPAPAGSGRPNVQPQ